MKQLAQRQTASMQWAWQSHLAVCPQSPPPHRLSKIVIIPRGSRCGKVWREQLDHIFQKQPTWFLVCFEASLSTLAPQKASSPLGVRFMMWFPASCLRRSALLPQGQEAPLLLESLPTLCSVWVMPVSPCGELGCCECCIGVVWFGIGAHTLSLMLFMSLLMPVIENFNHKLLSLALNVTFKKTFLWAF